jgi:hypothetical protein
LNFAQFRRMQLSLHRASFGLHLFGSDGGHRGCELLSFFQHLPNELPSLDLPEIAPLLQLGSLSFVAQTQGKPIM